MDINEAISEATKRAQTTGGAVFVCASRYAETPSFFWLVDSQIADFLMGDDATIIKTIQPPA